MGSGDRSGRPGERLNTACNRQHRQWRLGGRQRGHVGLVSCTTVVFDDARRIWKLLSTWITAVSLDNAGIEVGNLLYVARSRVVSNEVGGLLAVDFTHLAVEGMLSLDLGGAALDLGLVLAMRVAVVLVVCASLSGPEFFGVVDFELFISCLLDGSPQHHSLGRHCLNLFRCQAEIAFDSVPQGTMRTETAIGESVHGPWAAG